MLAVHNEGVGLCGIYPFEVAETKVETVRAMAKNAGYPLRCSMEKE
jgi:ATP-dependent Clp protease adaptor protein ClpS